MRVTEAISKITVTLSREQMRKPLEEFYQTVALAVGYEDGEVRMYDCTRILVAKNVQDEIIHAYQELCPGAPLEAIIMLLGMKGPKVDPDLEADEVLIQSGFIRLKGA